MTIPRSSANVLSKPHDIVLIESSTIQAASNSHVPNNFTIHYFAFYHPKQTYFHRSNVIKRRYTTDVFGNSMLFESVCVGNVTCDMKHFKHLPRISLFTDFTFKCELLRAAKESRNLASVQITLCISSLFWICKCPLQDLCSSFSGFVPATFLFPCLLGTPFWSRLLFYLLYHKFQDT